MSGNIIPLAPPSQTALAHPANRSLPQQWGPPAPPTTPPPSTSMVRRYVSVLGRFKWLILLTTLIGTAAGILATRFIDPAYVVDSTVWIASESPITDPKNSNGPAQANELVAAEAWPLLLRTGAVADEVVRALGLYVERDDPADSAVFRDFHIADRFRPGRYELQVQGNRYTLVADGQTPVDKGVVGDSIGRSLGLLWRPDPALLHAGPHGRLHPAAAT